MSQKTKVNKFLAGAVTATMVATAVVPTAALAAQPSDAYSDVKDLNADTLKELDRALEYGLMSGYQNAGLFKPKAFMNRGQVAKSLAKYEAGKQGMSIAQYYNAKGLDGKVTPFADVPKTHIDKELYQASLIVKDAGTFTGVQNKLNPTQNIERGHMATVLVRAFGLKSTGKAADFADLKDARSQEIRDAIQILKDNGIAKEVTSNKFNPNNAVQRIQMASFLVRSYEEVNGSIENPVEEGITNAKALNDTRIEVTFKDAVAKDFIREAEKNGKYFAVYTAGNNVQSKDTVQSEKINFSKDGKTATFDLAKKDGIESGKKYYVALLDGDNKEVAEVVNRFGPVELKESASRPEFEVSATADKIYVDFGTKMKDSALKVENYEVYDEGGKKLGKLEEFLAKDNKKEGKWVELNDKQEVEFKLGTDSDKKLSAGKTYKLKVNDKVKTDDNKTLSETERTITVETPSLSDAQPEAKVARITGKKEITIIFDKDLGKDVANINAAQLDLRTSTGKTVNVKSAKAAVKAGAENALVVTLDVDSKNELDSGMTYKIDMPANIVKNGIFVNAMNKETTALEAEAQENIAIKEMTAEIVSNAKNTGQADLILTFDQVPVLDSTLLKDIQLFDKRDEYKLKSSDIKNAKFYGGDDSGKSIIIEDIGSKFTHPTKKDLVVRGDKSYDIEIKTGSVKTDSFDGNKATNKSKLKASTSGVSVSRPVLDEVVLESAEKIVLKFKEDIKGNVSASDLSIDAYVANRSDIFEVQTATSVSGSGYYSVDVSGKELTLTAKEGVKFPTSYDALAFTIDADAFTNSDGNNGNPKLTKTSIDKKDYVDNAAPEIVSVYAKNSNQVEVTFTEKIETEGKNADIATLFFTDGGEEATEGKTFSASGNKATITFKDNFADNATDLSKVELEYKSGNTFYIRDAESNKVESVTIEGFYKDRNSSLDKEGTGNNGNGENPTDPEEGEVVTASFKEGNMGTVTGEGTIKDGTDFDKVVVRATVGGKERDYSVDVNGNKFTIRSN